MLRLGPQVVPRKRPLISLLPQRPPQPSPRHHVPTRAQARYIPAVPPRQRHATAATLLQLPYGTRCTLRALALMIGSSGGSKACRGAALEYNNNRIGGIINRASRPLRLALFLSRRRLEMMDGNLRVSKQNDLDHVRILYISWGLIRW